MNIYIIGNLPQMNTQLEAGHELQQDYVDLCGSETSRYFGWWNVGTLMIHGKVKLLTDFGILDL